MPFEVKVHTRDQAVMHKDLTPVDALSPALSSRPQPPPLPTTHPRFTPLLMAPTVHPVVGPASVAVGASANMKLARCGSHLAIVFVAVL